MKNAGNHNIKRQEPRKKKGPSPAFPICAKLQIDSIDTMADEKDAQDIEGNVRFLLWACVWPPIGLCDGC